MPFCKTCPFHDGHQYIAESMGKRNKFNQKQAIWKTYVLKTKFLPKSCGTLISRWGDMLWARHALSICRSVYQVWCVMMRDWAWEELLSCRSKEKGNVADKKWSHILFFVWADKRRRSVVKYIFFKMITIDITKYKMPILDRNCAIYLIENLSDIPSDPMR